VHPDGEIRALETSGLPVGMFEEFGYEGWSVELGAGDLLLCYSDGVIEAENAAEEQFGEQRLRDIVRETQGRPPAEIIRAIRSAVDVYRDEQPYEDDITLVALGRDA
jgi:sigma-B regulation protein RsbU (phosphoserine phosphatase)